MNNCVYSVILSYFLYNALFSRINAYFLRDIDYRNQTYIGIKRFCLYNNVKVLLREILQKILNTTFAKRHQLKIQIRDFLIKLLALIHAMLNRRQINL
jgi:hypothetical protein